MGRKLRDSRVLASHIYASKRCPYFDYCTGNNEHFVIDTWPIDYEEKKGPQVGEMKWRLYREAYVVDRLLDRPRLRRRSLQLQKFGCFFNSFRRVFHMQIARSRHCLGCRFAAHSDKILWNSFAVEEGSCFFESPTWLMGDQPRRFSLVEEASLPLVSIT